MNRQQTWAESAFGRVRSIKTGGDQSKYRTHALKFPSLLLQSGLAQAVAFVQSRDTSGAMFVKHLAETLGQPNLPAAARTAGLGEYVRLSSDALAVSAWYRRFAQTELEGGDQ